MAEVSNIIEQEVITLENGKSLTEDPSLEFAFCIGGAFLEDYV